MADGGFDSDKILVTVLTIQVTESRGGDARANRGVLPGDAPDEHRVLIGSEAGRRHDKRREKVEPDTLLGGVAENTVRPEIDRRMSKLGMFGSVAEQLLAPADLGGEIVGWVREEEQIACFEARSVWIARRAGLPPGPSAAARPIRHVLLAGGGSGRDQFQVDGRFADDVKPDAAAFQLDELFGRQVRLQHLLGQSVDVPLGSVLHNDARAIATELPNCALRVQWSSLLSVGGGHFLRNGTTVPDGWGDACKRGSGLARRIRR